MSITVKVEKSIQPALLAWVLCREEAPSIPCVRGLEGQVQEMELLSYTCFPFSSTIHSASIPR